MTFKNVPNISNFYPVILAGGRGTRFWPLSRKKRAKQLLALDGKQTMIQQAVARLLPLAPAKRFWVITNDDLRPAILKQLPKLPKSQVLAGTCRAQHCSQRSASRHFFCCARIPMP